MMRFIPTDLPEYKVAEIRVVHKQVNYNYQIDLFNALSPMHRYNTITGNFFELLTKLIFGGEKPLHDNTELQPDLVGENLQTWSWVREVKSVSWMHECKIATEQVRKYETIPAKMKYTLYKHLLIDSFSKMQGFSVEEVFKLLSENVGFLIDIPFSIINKAFIENGSAVKYVSFYTKEHWGNYARFHSKGMKELIKNPYQVLNELGVARGRYRIIKRTLPAGTKINGIEIKPFPILLIKDRLFEYNYSKKIVPF